MESNWVAETVAQIGGSVAGATMVTWGAPRLGVSPLKASIGATAVGLITAMGTKGWVRQAAMGAAAGACAIGILEWLDDDEPKPVEQPKRQAGADEAPLTREEMEQAIARFKEQSEKQAQEMVGELQKVVADLKTELPAMVAARSTPEPEQLTAEQLAHLQAICESLTPEEQKQLAAIEERAPAEMLARLRSTLLGLPVEAAVEYLRKRVFARRPPPNGKAAS
jgi:hypothetical protein